jgi:hypothetical protein
MPTRGHADIPNMVTAVRDGEPVAVLYVGQGPEAIRRAVYWAAAMLRADSLFVVADARYREYRDMSREQDAARGQEHRPGDFQRDWEAGNREGLTECLMIERLPAMGPSEMVCYPYVRHGRRLTWGQAHPVYKGGDLDGAVPGYARQGFDDARTRMASLMETLERAWGEYTMLQDMTPEERSWRTDRAIARFLSDKDEVGMVVVLKDRSEFMAGREVGVD